MFFVPILTIIYAGVSTIMFEVCSLVRILAILVYSIVTIMFDVRSLALSVCIYPFMIVMIGRYDIDTIFVFYFVTVFRVCFFSYGLLLEHSSLLSLSILPI